MPKLLAAGIVLFLLFSAGYALTQAARAIPWDCSDWQAFAHADRTTAILESLAENRGKTLYCGIDQSDTFAKAETWAAGKDRNERDDTVYYGERGHFRGFIAAQEGWLTEGESGITGQSQASIFEFPKEERRRVKRVKRFSIASEGFCPDPHPDEDSDPHEQANPPPGTLLCTDWTAHSDTATLLPAARKDAKAAQIIATATDGVSRNKNNAWTVDWQTFPTAAYWQEKAATAATAACRARGGQSVSNVAFGRGHDLIQQYDRGVADRDRGVGLGWFFLENDGAYPPFNFRARQSRTWTATCKKVTRRTRR